MEEQPDLPREEGDGVSWSVAPPVERQADEVARDLAVRERAAAGRVRDAARVACLTRDRRRDARRRLIRPVRAGVVADVEVELPVGRDQRQLARRHQVARGERREAGRTAGQEPGERKHGAPLTPREGDARQHRTEADDEDKGVGAVEGEERGDQAGHRPAAGAPQSQARVSAHARVATSTGSSADWRSRTS